MIVYKDRSFCDSDCINIDCGRYFSEYHKAKATEIDLPVSWTDFSTDCEKYIKPNEQSN